MIGITENILGKEPLFIAVWWRVVSSNANVVVLKFKEGGVGFLGPNVRFLYGLYKINRSNSDQDLLIVNIINTDQNVINTTSDVVHYDYVNRMMVVLSDGGWSI